MQAASLPAAGRAGCATVINAGLLQQARYEQNQIHRHLLPGRSCCDSPIHEEAADADGDERNCAAKSHGHVADKRGRADAAAL